MVTAAIGVTFSVLAKRAIWEGLAILSGLGIGTRPVGVDAAGYDLKTDL
jgi:hypothetical protein